MASSTETEARPSWIRAARAVREPLDGSVSPERAALLVRDDVRPFALVGLWAGAQAVVGSEPALPRPAHVEPFDVLDLQPSVADAPADFVGGGWFGVWGYELRHGIEALHGGPPERERLPAASLAFYDHVLRLDAEGQWWFEALWTERRAAVLERRRRALAARLVAGAPVPRRITTTSWKPTPSPAGHALAVAACRERIAAGDLFQANIAMRLRARLTTGTAVDLFTHAVGRLRPDRAAFLGTPDGDIASLSPELFVERHGDVIRSAPIKGTRPRHRDPEADETARARLAASEKDRAENVMIVDLVRNDLGRVCEMGTVEVPVLAQVRPHAGVWHLVSEVRGRRLRGVRDSEVMAALFPPGSVTGAPKIAAMNVISELESAPRQSFCGAIGFSSPVAGLELSVAIRTFEHRDGHLWLDVGGGVVADSDPRREAEECLTKARPLLRALGSDILATSATDPVKPPLRLGPIPTARPDPRRGVFETLRVEGGQALAAEEHVRRLAASARLLYGLTLPGDLIERVRRRAAGCSGTARLRIVLDADGALRCEIAELTPAAGALELDPVTVPGGIGAHKWQDRRLLEALEQRCAPRMPLLVDLDGTVLETSRANVFAIIDDTLVTPPDDGRILRGVGRAGILRHARSLGVPTSQRDLGLRELASADAVFTISALRGVGPVAAIAASVLDPAGHPLLAAIASPRHVAMPDTRL